MRWNPKKVSKGKLIIHWKSKLIILSLLYVIAIIHQIIKGSGYCFSFLNPVVGLGAFCLLFCNVTLIPDA